MKRFLKNGVFLRVGGCNSIPDSALAALDAAVAELDKFEVVRYPDSIVANGMAVQLAPFRGDLAASTATVLNYEVALEDINHP